MISESHKDDILTGTALAIRQNARRSYDQMLELLETGISPRDAINQSLRAFEGPYYEDLSKAFSEVLGQEIGTRDVRRWRVVDTTLSDKLYANRRVVEASTMAVLREHVAGVRDLRRTALELYEGYEFRRREVLDIQIPLPRYIERAVPVANEAQRVLARYIAADLKTPALKAAYLQALDGIERDVTKEVRNKLLEIAYYERNRYLANRIAQTEIQRAYADQRAREYLNDDGLTWVEWRLHPSHPKPDICDHHASVDSYGVGPGVFLKHDAPMWPAHPFCKCTVRPRYDIELPPKRKRAKVDLAWLRQQDPNFARQVMGSRDKLQEALQGKPLKDIWNRNVPEGYGFRTLGEATKERGPGPIRKPGETPQPTPRPTPAPTPAPTVAPKAPKGDMIRVKSTDDAELDSAITKLKAEGKKAADRLLAPPSRDELMRAGITDESLLASYSKTPLYDIDGGLFHSYKITKIYNDRLRAEILANRAMGNEQIRYNYGKGDNADIDDMVKTIEAFLPDDFRRVSNKAPPNFFAEEVFGAGGSYSPNIHRISLPDNFCESITRHEHWHHLQTMDPKLDAIFQREHRRRTEGKPLIRRAGSVAGSGVWYRDGGYVDNYQGREYFPDSISGTPPTPNARGDADEMITVAMESVAAETDLKTIRTRIKKDQEMYHLSIGVLTKYEPD